ncbi:transcriptional regulator [Roseomonas sp. M0104]|uniref:Transcriptional regulator n=1 Tax=Teichococcus coralli TaxID=2545983 RepID=A0A845BBF9_9PROT|nr:helix-turn-helix domain-containing protein [Pseudoroseomonas coralli]MXP63424.1 transcriptional regulator [Pseudoroseomonas coralli]
MVQTDFSLMRCPVARSMSVLGERWAILVLREAFYGTTRFEEFERHLGIAPNILSARLAKLVEHGLLERVAASGRGARHQYRLTGKGRDFFPAYVALKRWADRWMTDPSGPPVLLVEAVTGEEVRSPPLIGSGGAPLCPEDVRVLPGPGAGERMRRRFAGAGGDDA